MWLLPPVLRKGLNSLPISPFITEFLLTPFPAGFPSPAFTPPLSRNWSPASEAPPPKPRLWSSASEAPPPCFLLGAGREGPDFCLWVLVHRLSFPCLGLPLLCFLCSDYTYVWIQFWALDLTWQTHWSWTAEVTVFLSWLLPTSLALLEGISSA